MMWTRYRYELYGPETQVIDQAVESAVAYQRVGEQGLTVWSHDEQVAEPVREYTFGEAFNTCHTSPYYRNPIEVSEGEFRMAEYGLDDAIPFPKKSYLVGFGVDEYAHGLGLVLTGIEFSSSDLVYARINGREYGTPLRERFNIAVSAESAEALRGQRLGVYPNPVRDVATIQFELDRPRAVSLEVVDVTGRAVARLLNGEQRAAGTHTVTWPVSSVSAGVYGLRLTGTGGLWLSRSIVVVR
ncbi:MAG: T9SS type A sorting domain-containing protein [Bacteroidota bacterium]